MTEKDYINATNLAKLNAAAFILRECLFSNESDCADSVLVHRAIARLIDRTRKTVKVR